MLSLSATKAPPALGLVPELPAIRLQLSLREAGRLISALKADADAALEAGDIHLHRQLRDRAADLRETAAGNARRILGNLGPKRAPQGRARA